MSSQTITIEDVKKMAKLAKLNVLGEEEKLAGLFTDTLEKVAVLNELDTSHVAETFQVTGLTNVFQEVTDSTSSLTKDQALANAKEVSNGLIATKGVFDRSA